MGEMPYVEIWVDNEPCDGSCDEAREAQKLKDKIDEAVSHLREGHIAAALQSLTEDKALPCKTPCEIESRYEQWRKGQLPGFENYTPPRNQ
jgi:hypothetical protein